MDVQANLYLCCMSGVRYYIEMLIESPPSRILDVSNNQGCNYIYENIFSI